MKTYICLSLTNEHDLPYRDSLEPTLKGIEYSKSDNDDEGVITGLVNLYEIYRYSSKTKEAIDVCNQLCELFSKLKDDKSYHNYMKQIEILQKGEPLNRVVAVVDGKNYELEDIINKKVAVKNVQVEFHFLRNRLTLPSAKYLINIAKNLQANGEYSSAVFNLQSAITKDQYAPEPWYQLGVCYLHLERSDDALDAFKKAAELAPGWFDVNFYIWVAESMKAAKFNLEAFKVMYVLEHGQLNPGQKITICERVLKSGTKLPYILLHLGLAYQQTPGKLDMAESAFRGALLLTDDLDIDTKTRVLFNLGATVPTVEEKNNVFEQATKVNGNLTAAAMSLAALALD